MIPRYQRILFVVFLAAAILMAAELSHLRHATQERLLESMADAPLVSPSQVATAPVKLLLASDVDDSLRMVEKQLPVPTASNARARYVLQALLAEYSAPLSQHPLPAGGSAEDVYLLPIDVPALDMAADPEKKSCVAVVNLDRAFVENHPSGLATEMLTVRSMVGTLHANLPCVVAVRFLVEGQPAATLAGHADLLHIYSATEEKEIALDQDLYKETP
jgi:hypothetical protein